MPFPVEVNLQVAELFGGTLQRLALVEGLTTLVGPNGSGKTQVLHALRQQLSPHVNNKKVRYVSPGRLARIEQFRSDRNGDRGGHPNYSVTPVGGQHLIPTRHGSFSITGDMLALHQRSDLRIRVEARLQALFQPRISLEWSRSGLQIEFTRTGE